MTKLRGSIFGFSLILLGALLFKGIIGMDVVVILSIAAMIIYLSETLIQGLTEVIYHERRQYEKHKHINY